METRVKKSFICSHVNLSNLDSDIINTYSPKVGDVAIFEVTSIGKHTTIQGDSKRNEKIMPGDFIMAAFGHRYATAQFEGYVPEKPMSEYHILGAGGVVGIVKSVNDKFKDGGPTKLKIVGYVKDNDSNIANTVNYYQDEMVKYDGMQNQTAKIVLSIGSSMDSGKTTTAAHMVYNLKKQGKRVAFIKLTGTAYTKDADLNYDLGADVALDFSCLGYPSTYLCSNVELLNIYQTLVEKANKFNPEYIIMEIADGIFQRETFNLLQNQSFMSTITDVVFSANDSLSAVCGVNTLKDWGISVHAISGMFTTSPLLISEVKNVISTPVYTLKDWQSHGIANLIKTSSIRIVNNNMYQVA